MSRTWRRARFRSTTGSNSKGRARRDARDAARRCLPVLRQTLQGAGARGLGAGIAVRAEPSRVRDLFALGARHPDGAAQRRAERPVRPRHQQGALVNILAAARKPFAAQTNLIKQRLLSGTALASDETGMRVGKANWWLWVFHHGDSAAFVAEARRSKAVVETFLGDWRPDVWLSDRLGSQIGWARREHQFCLAHLIRDVQYVIDQGEATFARPEEPAQARLRPRAEARRAGRQHPENLSRRSQSQARSPPGPQARPRGGAKTSGNHQGNQGQSLRLHDQSGDRGHQQWLRARVTSRRGLSKNHQRLPKRMGAPPSTQTCDPSSKPRDDAASAPSTPYASPSKVARSPSQRDNRKGT